MHALSINSLHAPAVVQPEPASRLLTALRLQTRLALAVFLGFLVVIALLVQTMPKSYEASMEFLVSNDRVSNPIGPGKNTQALLYLDDISEGRINTEVALLTSNDLLRDVVRKCKLSAEVKTPHLSEASREEAALNQLRGHLDVKSLKKAAVIHLSVRASSPERATEILLVLSGLYLDSRVRLSGTAGAYAFYDGLWKETARELSDAQQRLTAFKQAHNIVSLPEERANALQTQADLERKLEDADTAVAGSAQKNNKLSSLISTTPELIVHERKSIPNQSEIQQLSTRLNELQNKRIEAASRYTPEDRFVTDLDKQISQTKVALSDATSGSTEEVASVANPILIDERAEAARAQSERAAEEARAAALRGRLNFNRSKLATLDAHTGAYTVLVDDVSRLNDLVRDYRQKADAAQVSIMLDRSNISNVEVSEEPFAVGKPVSPNKPILLGLGFAWSSVLAIGAAVVANLRSRRVLSASDVEACLDAPVLADVDTRSRVSAPQRQLTSFTIKPYAPVIKKTWGTTL